MQREITDYTKVNETFGKKILLQKLSNPLVLVFLALVALFISVVVYKLGIIGAGGIIVIIIGLPALAGIVAYPKFGITVLIVVSFFINYVSEFLPEQVPIGTLLDAITYLLILGFFIKQKSENNWSYFKNPISVLIIIWLAYNMVEVANPAASSVLAWVYTVRTVGFIMLMYFVFVYHIRTVGFIKYLLKLWLLLDVIAAISAFQQENFGFLPFEKKWLYSDPLRVGLLFINGHMRKFGIFSDPVTFSYNMVIGSLLCIALMMTNITIRKKIILGCIAMFFLTVMLYSGTRAAYVLLPASLVILAVLNFNRKVLIGTLIAGFMLAVLIVMPTSNPSIKRFQTAFSPSDDPSYNVRAENQKKIKPFILSHPIGGGLGSVGVWGRRFAPNSMLAKFPPDSGYVRVAVEMGWIGLILFCTLFFVVLKNGINFFFLIKNPRLKNYCMAMILVIFAFNIGNFPQQAIVQYPSNIIFYLSIAIIVACRRLDLEEQQTLMDGDKTTLTEMN
ncbi:O-antigen ligase family protein [Mucilaginibacter ginsenosidivorax]|uniref:O-antigen ligase family protein n=1 Tax=Mucilaginibacter ginsenosidivorax TaxID=862126 RepID=A0A5B8VWA9_9SPHI|nr:O-antigen ligase family protein [Mucilaginibacter ginsenosidivorax]QEC74508.1 O-antigen ligase family protein [Mucilaginibacter ginsenosidivorax]